MSILPFWQSPVFWIKSAVTAAVLVAVMGAGVRCGRDLEVVAHQKTREQHAAVLADLARQAELVRIKVRQHELATQTLYMAQSTRYEKEKTDARNEGVELGRRIAAGAVRLQPQWECPRAAPGGVPGTAAVPGEPDARAGLQAASVGRIDTAVAECEAQVRGLQALSP